MTRAPAHQRVSSCSGTRKTAGCNRGNTTFTPASNFNPGAFGPGAFGPGASHNAATGHSGGAAHNIGGMNIGGMNIGGKCAPFDDVPGGSEMMMCENAMNVFYERLLDMIVQASNLKRKLQHWEENLLQWQEYLEERMVMSPPESDLPKPPLVNMTSTDGTKTLPSKLSMLQRRSSSRGCFDENAPLSQPVSGCRRQASRELDPNQRFHLEAARRILEDALPSDPLRARNSCRSSCSGPVTRNASYSDRPDITRADMTRAEFSRGELTRENGHGEINRTEIARGDMMRADMARGDAGRGDTAVSRVDHNLNRQPVGSLRLKEVDLPAVSRPSYDGRVPKIETQPPPNRPSPTGKVDVFDVEESTSSAEPSDRRWRTSTLQEVGGDSGRDGLRRHNPDHKLARQHTNFTEPSDERSSYLLQTGSDGDESGTSRLENIAQDKNVYSLEARTQDVTAKKRPNLPTLNLENPNIVGSAWLCGAQTQGDTYENIDNE